MKFFHLLIATAWICTGSTVYAQNRILVLNHGDSIGNKVKLLKGAETPGYSSDFTYNIPAVPSAITSGIPVAADMREAARQSVNRFQTVHLYNGRVDFGRDVLDGDYAWTHNMDFDGASYRLMAKKDSIQRSVLKKSLFSNKVVQEAMYQWLFPAFRDAFSVMSVPEQKAYLAMLRESIAFADTFSLENQKAVVDRNYNYADAVGSLNAFIYRRVANKELSRQDCVQWLNRILSDLSPAQTKNPTPEDDLVLAAHLGYGYYSAAPFEDVQAYYGAEYSIVRKTNEQYSILPVPKFKTAQLDEPETNFVVGYGYENGHYQRYLFYCDSTGYVFTRTPYEHDVKNYQFLGEGKSARLLLIHYFDFDYSNPQNEFETMTIATVVDLDSGTILIDSVCIPQEVHYEGWDDYGSDPEFPVLKKERIIFYSYPTRLYGVMDNKGNVLLQPVYRSVEFTDEPEIVKVNGKKNVLVRGGGKPPKKKK